MPDSYSSWRIVELVNGERRPYVVKGQEWRGSEKRAKALADTLSVQERFFVAEVIQAIAC